MAKTNRRITERKLVQKQGVKPVSEAGPSHASGKAERAAAKKKEKLKILAQKKHAGEKKQAVGGKHTSTEVGVDEAEDVDL
mmetsp:Transcript_66958/g.174226  ORF Transcript_66958/g.174226 Transcript_66958/m.174226 type:complete len:81 (-) Transcript_66958:120-362(-)